MSTASTSRDPHTAATATDRASGRNGNGGNNANERDVDVAVIGGGIAGLTAAITAAQFGARVRLYDARRDLGGRARSDLHEGFQVSHGAHALYLHGAGGAVLSDLGIEVSGRAPTLRGTAFWKDGAVRSALRPSTIGGVGALGTLARMLRDSTIDAARGVSAERWLCDQPAAHRDVLRFAIRLSTFAATLDNVDAGAALAQVRSGVKGVSYLDGGWQQLTDKLVALATATGVEFVTAKVNSLRADVERGWRLSTTAGEASAGAVIGALGGAHSLNALLDTPNPSLAAAADAAEPVMAYCLDILHRGPLRRTASLYGLGTPTYWSNFSRSADVAPHDGTLLCGVVYEPDARPDAQPNLAGRERATLEAQLSAWAPEWRDGVVDIIERRRMVVSHDRPRVSGATASVAVAGTDNLFLAGDALGDHGWLADAALSSGAEAGRRAGAIRHRRSAKVVVG